MLLLEVINFLTPSHFENEQAQLLLNKQIGNWTTYLNKTLKWDVKKIVSIFFTLASESQFDQIINVMSKQNNALAYGNCNCTMNSYCAATGSGICNTGGCIETNGGCGWFLGQTCTGQCGKAVIKEEE